MLNGDCEIWLKFLSPISNSIIAAILCAYAMDIPRRMTEYQGYFIKLLTSSDYLKIMDESDLIKLHEKVIWQLHIKDVPRMPKGLIKLDNKILGMLKRPYFKEYNQTIIISQSNKGNNYLKKNGMIDYIAYNPYPNEHPVKMDIGMSFSLLFENNDVSVDTAQELFKLQKMTIIIDDKPDEVNILSKIKINVVNKKEDGLIYNGKVLLKSKKGDKEENILHISDKDYDANNEGDNRLTYELSEQTNNELWIEFSNKIRVHIDYEIHVPKADVSYTKRLRYPVKYFRLDYNMADDLNYTLVGQLLGTLIDQPDVSFISPEPKKSISIRTHNWLLPKNGTMIVHCKE